MGSEPSRPSRYDRRHREGPRDGICRGCPMPRTLDHFSMCHVRNISPGSGDGLCCTACGIPYGKLAPHLSEPEVCRWIESPCRHHIGSHCFMDLAKRTLHLIWDERQLCCRGKPIYCPICDAQWFENPLSQPLGQPDMAPAREEAARAMATLFHGEYFTMRYLRFDETEYRHRASIMLQHFLEEERLAYYQVRDIVSDPLVKPYILKLKKECTEPLDSRLWDPYSNEYMKPVDPFHYKNWTQQCVHSAVFRAVRSVKGQHLRHMLGEYVANLSVRRLLNDERDEILRPLEILWSQEQGTDPEEHGMTWLVLLVLWYIDIHPLVHGSICLLGKPEEPLICLH